MIQPDDLLASAEPEDLATLNMQELRDIREQLQEIEFGYSYARRVVQGRLDIVLGLLEPSKDDSDQIKDLSDAMAGHIKGPGLPRPTKGLTPPDWADDLLDEMNTTMSLDDLSNMADMAPTDLADIAERISAMERDLSQARATLHSRIERIQAEVISRYRNGAGVEDLLS